MNYQSFISAVREGIRHSVKADVDVQIQTVVKNNGIERRGLTFQEKEINISPTIYLEEYYEQFQRGESMDEIIRHILELYYEVRFRKSWEMDYLKDYEEVRQRVVMKLINREQNMSLLKGIPYVSYLDFAVVFYILLSTKENESATVTITNDHLRYWGVEKEELYEDAMKNSPHLLPCTIKTMKQAVAEMLGTDAPENDVDNMYIVSNETKNLGASCILYPHVMEKVYERIGENFYILPSSIHEVIVIPESKSPMRTQLDCMIQEVNETQVEEEEVLSSHAYYYSHKEGRIFL